MTGERESHSTAPTSLTEVVDEDAADDGAAASAQAVVDSLQNPLGRASQLLRGVVGDVGAARRPHGRVRDALPVTTNTV